MPGLQSYATSVALNTELLPPGSLPGRVDDAARQIQADIAIDYRDREWTEYGDGDGAGDGTSNYSCTYVDTDIFLIAGADVTSAYHVGRPLRAIGTLTGTIYGVIFSSSYDGVNTTVVFAPEDAGLQSEGGLRVWISTLPANGRALPIASINGRPIDMQGETLTEPVLTQYAEQRTTLSIASGVVAWDIAVTGPVAFLRLTEDVTSITIAGWADAPNACSPVLYRQQDDVGGRTMTGWPVSIAWFGGTEPPPTADAYAVDAIGLSTLDGGVSVMGSANLGAIFTGFIG